MASDSATKDPTLQDLIEKFKDVPTARTWLEGVSAVPDFASAFPDIQQIQFIKKLGQDLGTLVYNAAHPSNPPYRKWDLLAKAKNGSTTNLRKLLSSELQAQEWQDLATTAENSVSNSNVFEALWEHLSHFKLAKPKPNKENEMYEDTKNIFEPIATKLGGFLTQTEAREPDRFYPDEIAPKSSFELVVSNTILDIEIKKPWKPIDGGTPWESLYSHGNARDTPIAGLKEVIARAEQFFGQPTTQQQTYYAVISDLLHFVFFAIDRAGNMKLTFPVDFGKTPVAMIWYLCSLRREAGGFRNAASSLPLPPSSLPLSNTNEFMSSAEANPEVILHTESRQKWVLTFRSLLGQGSHGLVFSCKQSNFAKSENEMDQLCLKLVPESCSTATELLELEAFHLDLIHNCPYVPKVLAKGKVYLGVTPCQGLLTDVVGVTLPSLSKSQLKSILPNLWSEMCFVLGQIHSRQLVHCDVKPDHFVVNHSGLWIVDFGSSFHPFSRLLRQNNLYTTPMFSSAHVLTEDGTWPTQQDDVQSAAYSFVSLLSGDEMLPEGHQSDPNQLISIVRPQHRQLVRSVLTEAHLIYKKKISSSFIRFALMMLPYYVYCDCVKLSSHSANDVTSIRHAKLAGIEMKNRLAILLLLALEVLVVLN